MTREEQIELVLAHLRHGGPRAHVAARIVGALEGREERLTKAEWWERVGEQIGVRKAHPVEVTDEMVHAAQAEYERRGAIPGTEADDWRAALRAALGAGT